MAVTLYILSYTNRLIREHFIHTHTHTHTVMSEDPLDFLWRAAPGRHWADHHSNRQTDQKRGRRENDATRFLTDVLGVRIEAIFTWPTYTHTHTHTHTERERERERALSCIHHHHEFHTQTNAKTEKKL